jgi:hypothetical protein
MTSPTARTLEHLRKEGYLCQVVERFNQFSMKRIDLYGVIDIVAIRKDQPGVWGIQATSTSNLPARVKKAMESEELLVWLQAGNRFSCWGWAKRGKKDERKLWTLKERDFTLSDGNLSCS